MRQLIQLAIRSRKHLSLLVATLLTLLALTVASQLEMFALGLMSNSGSDFFALFSRETDSKVQTQNVVFFEDVQTNWGDIDLDHTGKITKKEAAVYLAKKKDSNPLSWVIHKVKQKFAISDNLKILVCTLIGVAVFKAGWLFASRYTTQLLAIRVSRDLRQYYFEHIQSLPMSFYQQYNIGSLSSRVVGDAAQISLSINSCLTNYLQSPFTLFSSLVACFFISWKLSLVIFFGVPLIIIPIVFFARRVKRVSRQLQRNQERFASVLIDFLAGIQTVKIFSMESFSLRKYREQNDRMAVLESKTAKYGLLTRPILHAITTLCLASVVIFGLVTLGIPVSQLIVFCGLLHLAYEPVKKFAEENANIQRGVVAAERMFEVLNIRPHIEDKDGAVDLKGFEDKIEFENVWFRYQGDWVLKDLSFTIRKGETIAIVGPTGAGKSTIVQLLPRLYDVEKGEIRIDGISIRDYSQKSLRDNISFVSQKPFLFCDTVAANIAYGQDFPKEEIELAAKKAHADEFIVNLPEKYDTMLAEAGQNLSGGQQQRLAIARALVKDAPILILDEATSALDALSETRIKKAIAELHGEITQIIIAHRLATIENADRILYLEHGVKIAEGTRDELLESCLPFRLMWNEMFKSRVGEVVSAPER
jgi:ABC-type multidrug transport system fused ATPase/permease subunit